MAEWLGSFVGWIAPGWSNVLIGVGVFVIASVGGLVMVSILLVRLPADHFCRPRSRGPWADRHPVLRWSALIGKNLLGLFAVLLGVALSLPGIPGPGVLTILVGILLLDFPGKRRFECWLVRRPRVLGSINRLRLRYGKPPLQMP